MIRSRRRARAVLPAEETTSRRRSEPDVHRSARCLECWFNSTGLVRQGRKEHEEKDVQGQHGDNERTGHSQVETLLG